MNIPFYTLLAPYAVGVFVFLLWSAFNLYHLFKFGMFDFTGKVHAFTFLSLSVVVIFITVLFLSIVPWFEPLSVSSLLPNTFQDDPFNSLF